MLKIPRLYRVRRSGGALGAPNAHVPPREATTSGGGISLDEAGGQPTLVARQGFTSRQGEAFYGVGQHTPLRLHHATVIPALMKFTACEGVLMSTRLGLSALASPYS